MKRRLILGGLAALLVTACQDKASPPPAKAAPPAKAVAKASAAPASKPAAAAAAEKATPEMAEAKTIFQQRCVTCHGATGKGDGPAAAALNPKPRSFADGAWQKTITDEHIATIIVKGGAGVKKSPLMPPNPDLEQKPKVVAALVSIVRGYAK